MSVRNPEKLPKSVLKEWADALTQWTDTAAFDALVRQIRSTPGFAQAEFTQGGLAFFRDAWIASRIALRLGADSVRLCPEDRPDFELNLRGDIRRYEVTEADMPGRRRGDEPIDPEPKMDPVEDWRKRFDAIGPSVSAVIAKKLRKTYDPEVALVVYVNLGCYGAYLGEGVSLLRKTTSAAKDHFSEVFAYWEGNLYRFWECGRSAFKVWKSDDADEFD